MQRHWVAWLLGLGAIVYALVAGAGVLVWIAGVALLLYGFQLLIKGQKT
jgi:hypothetical protein